MNAPLIARRALLGAVGAVAALLMAIAGLFRPHAAEYADDPVSIDAHDGMPDRNDGTHSRMIAPSRSFAMGLAPWGGKIFLL